MHEPSCGQGYSQDLQQGRVLLSIASARPGGGSHKLRNHSACHTQQQASVQACLYSFMAGMPPAPVSGCQWLGCGIPPYPAYQWEMGYLSQPTHAAGNVPQAMPGDTRLHGRLGPSTALQKAQDASDNAEMLLAPRRPTSGCNLRHPSTSKQWPICDPPLQAASSLIDVALMALPRLST